MPRSSFVDFKAVKAAITMERVLDHYGLMDKFTRKGDSLNGPCPIHKGSNPTQFRVSISKNIFNCFSECKQGGNVLDFIAKMENVSIHAAALKAIEWFHLDVESVARNSDEGEENLKPEPRTEPAPAPKKTARKQTPAEDASKPNKPLEFRLEKLERSHPYLIDRGLTTETLVDFGAGFCAKGMMAGRIAIPIHNPDGKVVAYAGRFVGEPTDDNPKYKLPPGFRKSLEVNAGKTNDLPIEFKYGTAVLESSPPGAVVTTPDGRERGVTPLTLTELQPGVWKFSLQLFNYEPAAVSLEIAGNQTNSFHTNLVSQLYTGAMRAARQFMNDGKYDEASASLADALRAQPNDPAAMTLQNEAIGLGSIARAETLRSQGEFIAGIKELEEALAALPDNERAKQMLADFKRREPEQIERMRVERLNRGKLTFESLIKAKYPEGDLFETHEIKTSKPLKDIELPLLSALRVEPLKFNVTKFNESTDLCAIEAVHEFSTLLSTSAGKRQLVIVGAQTKDDETQILFKVLEYKVEAVEKFSIGNLIGTPVNVKYVPIHGTSYAPLTEKFQARIHEGVSNVMAIVQGAIVQTLPEPR